MPLNRRQVLAGGLGLGAAVGLSACSGLTSKAGSSAPSAGASSGGKAELTFVNWSGDEEKAAFEKSCNAVRELLDASKKLVG